jgi:flagellar biosynthesis protein FlhG
MVEEELQRSFDRLGVHSDVSTREVERAYRELRDLYSEESLATYSLLEYADRQEKLESLLAAYDLILESRLILSSSHDDEASDEEDKKLPDVMGRIVCVDADPHQAPGTFLAQMREAQGLSIADVAERTKIGSFQLQGIEAQRFDVLPAPVYLRGFLKEFARVVEVPDVESLVDSFMALYLNDRDA